MPDKNEIKFGTDGWRGIISDNFTFKNVRRLSQAIADYYNRHSQTRRRVPTIAVGYDTRFLSDQYAQLVSEVLVNNGIDVILSDRHIPTPTLSFAVKERKLTAGVMITASHNPGAYNGLKIKTSQGGAAGVDITDEIEKLLAADQKVKKLKSGKLVKADLTKGYINFLRRYINLKKLRRATFRILVDAMYGSGNGFISEVLDRTKIKVEFLRNEINPSFGGLRPEPVLENLQPTIFKMQREKFDLGIVLDGDADRIAAFVENGEFINPQKILGLLILHLFEDRNMRGGVVKTIVGTNLIDKIALRLGLRLYETPVGFKYISELMQSKNILVGGEEAGGIGFKGYIPERDGTLAGILLLEMMVARRKAMLKIVQEMEKKYGRYYYLRQDIETKEQPGRAICQKLKQIKRIMDKKVVRVKDYDGVKLICADESWLMFRGSGTEPIMRLYAESTSLNKSKKLLEIGRAILKI